MLPLLFSLFVLGLCDWEAVYIFAGSSCYQDTNSQTPAYPLSFVATSAIAANLCLNTSCVTAGGFSFLTQCSANQPATPPGLVTYGVYTGTTSCSGSPSVVTGYTTGCTTIPLSQTVNALQESFQLTCKGNSLQFQEWASSGNCPSSPAPTVSVTYHLGCASYNVNGVKGAVSQVGCSNGGVSINWYTVFKTWAAYAAWVINALDTTVSTFVQTASGWTYNFIETGPVISVDVTFTGPQNTTFVATFVDTCCSQMLQQILNGICTNSVSGGHCNINKPPLGQHSCSYTVTGSAKRNAEDVEAQPTSITISQSLAQGSSGMMNRPQLIVMLVAFLMYFLKY